MTLNLILQTSTRGENRRNSLSLFPILCILFFCTAGSFISSAIPQTILLSLAISIAMLVRLRYRINREALAFVSIFLFCYFFGFIVSIFSGTLDLPSFVNLISSLGVFVVVSTYIIESLSRNPRRLALSIEVVLILYFSFSLLELLQYERIYELRNLIHGKELFEHNLRDVKLYGLARPTGLFSEPSNFGRVIGLLIALHVSTGYSKVRSVVWLIAFALLIRSPMIMYAAPFLILSFTLKSGDGGRKKSNGISKKTSWGIFGLVIVFALILYSQQVRFLSMLSGDDGSFIGRIGLPLLYMTTEWQDVFFGSGPTPLNEVDAFINDIWLVGRAWLVGEDFRIAVAPSIIVVIGMGVLGTTLFIGLVSYYLGGLWALIFFYCNFFANGVNGPSMFVPLAVIYGMYVFFKRSNSLKQCQNALND